MLLGKKEKELPTDDTPDYYYKDEDGYIYGRQCNKERRWRITLSET